MLKKKVKTLNRLQKTVEKNRPQNSGKLKKRQEEEEEEEVLDSTENNEEEDEDEENETVADPEDLDAAIDDVPEFDVPEPGTYPAIVDFVKEMEPNAKGKSIQMSFVLYVGDTNEENPIMRYSKFFKIFDADLKTRNVWGIRFYKRFMGKLGYEEGNRGEDARDEITENKPAITLKVTKNDQAEQYPNLDITGLLDDDNEDIQAIRDALENQPY